MTRRILLVIALAGLSGLSACGGQGTATDHDMHAPTVVDGDELPAPRASGGSVTGMPDAGEPGTSGIVIGSRGSDAPMVADSGGETALVERSPVIEPAAGQDVPTSAAARQVLRDYYARLDARDVEAARGMWQGQSPLQLLPPDVVSVSATVGAPGRIDAGAGQRHVEIPVTVVHTLADGRTRQVRMTYMLHASPVEGGNPDWKISAEQAR